MIQTTCPSCSKTASLPDNLDNKPFRCPDCNSVYIAKSGVGEQIATKGEGASSSPPAPPPEAESLVEVRKGEAKPPQERSKESQLREDQHEQLLINRERRREEMWNRKHDRTIAAREHMHEYAARIQLMKEEIREQRKQERKEQREQERREREDERQKQADKRSIFGSQKAEGVYGASMRVMRAFGMGDLASTIGEYKEMADSILGLMHSLEGLNAPAREESPRGMKGMPPASQSGGIVQPDSVSGRLDDAIREFVSVAREGRESLEELGKTIANLYGMEKGDRDKDVEKIGKGKGVSQEEYAGRISQSMNRDSGAVTKEDMELAKLLLALL